MNKRIFGGVLGLVCFFLVGFMIISGDVRAQEPGTDKKNKVTVNGIIIEVPENGEYILVDDGTVKTKFLSSKDFIEDAYLETGDKVKLYGEESSQGIKLIDYEYIYGEDSDQISETGDPQDDSQDDSSDKYDLYQED